MAQLISPCVHDWQKWKNVPHRPLIAAQLTVSGLLQRENRLTPPDGLFECEVLPLDKVKVCLLSLGNVNSTDTQSSVSRLTTDL